MTPSVGPEFELDTPTPVTGLGGPGPKAAAANAAGTTLLLWIAGNALATTAELYAARVGPDTTVLDPAGFAIAPARVPGVSSNYFNVAAVASDGSGWLVVWSDSRDGKTANVFGARVDAGGHVLDAEPFVISQALAVAIPALTVAWGGTDWLVAWTEPGASEKGVVKSARVTTAGVVEDAGGFNVATYHFLDNSPANALSVAHDDTAWVLTWADFHTVGDNLPSFSDPTGYDVVAARVGSATDVSGPFSIAGGRHWQEQASVACAGATCLFAWSDVDNGTGRVFTAARRAVSGALDATAFTVGTAPHSTVSFDGTNFAVGMTTGAARVTPAGAVIDSIAVPAGVAAGNGSGTLFTFPGALGQVDAQIWSSDGTLSSEFGVGSVYSVESNPAVAASDSAWLAVWLDNRNAVIGANGRLGSINDVYAVRIGADGAVLDTSPLPIAVNAEAKSNPHVVSDGSGWLVVWDEAHNNDNFYGVYGARVSAAGSVVPPGAFLIDGGDGFSRDTMGLGFDGTDFFLDWLQYPGCVGARVSTAGEISDRVALPLCGAIGSGPGQWFVAGWAPSTDGNTTWPIQGYRVGPDGAVLDADLISLGTTRSPGNVVVAAGAGSWLAAWANNDGARVSYAGVLLDATPLTVPPVTIPTAFEPTSTSGTYTGTEWVFVWSRGAETNWTPPYDLDGARVKNDGTLIDPSGFVIAAGPADGTTAYSGPVVAGGPGGRELVVYTRAKGPLVRLSARVLAADCVATSPTDTTCNGMDDDCDGVVDDACVQTGSGGEASGVGGTAGSAGLGGTAGLGVGAAAGGAAGESSGGAAEDGGAESAGTGGASAGGTSSAGTGAMGGGASGGTNIASGGAGTSSGGTSTGARTTGGSAGTGAAGHASQGGKGAAGHGGSAASGPQPSGSGCGCSVPRSASQHTFESVLLLAAAYAARRRRAGRPDAMR